MEGRHDLLLQHWPKINQNVAATDEIELREGRILGHILLGENAHRADAFTDLEARIEPREEAPEPLGRNVVTDAFRVDSGTRAFEGQVADVGAEDLNGNLGSALV